MATAKRGKAPPRLGSLPDAARYLGVSVDAVRGYIRTGKLTGYRIGAKLLRVDMDEVEAMVQQVPKPRPA